MNKFNSKMSLKDFAIAVATELKEHGIDVVLTGGAVVSIYSENKYVSNDADFLSASDHQNIVKAMQTIGFTNKGKDFFHSSTKFSVEFPGRTLIIGNAPMKATGSIKENGFTLRLLSPTQCVMDRLAAFYYWNDRQSLQQALLVAENHPVKLNEIKKWSENEGETSKFQEFLDGVKRKKGRR